MSCRDSALDSPEDASLIVHSALAQRPCPAETFGFGDLGAAGKDARWLTLGQAAPRKGFTMTYVYDFRDDWRHQIQVEDIGAAEPGPRTPDA